MSTSGVPALLASFVVCDGLRIGRVWYILVRLCKGYGICPPKIYWRPTERSRHGRTRGCRVWWTSFVAINAFGNCRHVRGRLRVRVSLPPAFCVRPDDSGSYAILCDSLGCVCCGCASVLDHTSAACAANAGVGTGSAGTRHEVHNCVGGRGDFCGYGPFCIRAYVHFVRVRALTIRHQCRTSRLLAANRWPQARRPHVGRMRPQDRCASYVIAVYRVVVDSCPREIAL
jgi:hypothetical protein